MKNVKNYIEIVLLIILVGCIYNGECRLLNDLMNNTVGKLSLLSLVVLILVYFGKTAGVLAACIYVFILHVNRKEGFEGLSLEVNTNEKKKKKGKWEKENEDDEDKEGFSIKIGSDSKDEDDDKKDKEDKEGYWAKRNKEGFDDDIEGMKNTISKLVKKVKKLEKNKKEGFANLRQNRRLKINNISVLNTTDLDRTIKKDSEVRTLNSTV